MPAEAGPVEVWAPYIETAQGLISPHYDLPAYRAEIAGWMAELGRAWTWVPVLDRTLGRCVEAARAAAATHPGFLVVNLCDGTESDGYPGLEVAEALQASGLAYTGADPAFYRITTSKADTKARLAAAGVPVPRAVRLLDPEADLARAGVEIGWPLFIKPDISAGSYGIQVDSVVHDVAAGLRKVQALSAGLHGQAFAQNGMLAEAFLDGREVTVLVIEDEAASEGLYIVPPAERVFDPRLPDQERFLAFERYWDVPGHARPLPPGEPYYWYALAPDDVAATARALAAAAFRAVGGRSYARIDLRADRRGRFAVLEVNAQCGLSSDDSSTVGSMLRLTGLRMVDLMARIMRHAGSRRPRSEDEVREALA